ncbi:MAG: hypothetical protein U0L66_08250 [Acutalibacteraceae bacterium]|nr:hypothetical protein [Acutalibacteraceae bacterium]
MRTATKNVSGQYFRLRIWGISGAAYHKKDRLQLEILHTADTSHSYSLSGTGTPLMSCDIWTTNGDARIDLTDYARAQAVGQTSTITITDYQGRALSFNVVAYEGSAYPLMQRNTTFKQQVVPPTYIIEQGAFTLPNVVVCSTPASVQGVSFNPYPNVSVPSDASALYVNDVYAGASGSYWMKIKKQVCGKHYIQLQWQSLWQQDSSVLAIKRAVWHLDKYSVQTKEQDISQQVGNVAGSLRSLILTGTASLDDLSADDVAYYADIIVSNEVYGWLFFGESSEITDVNKVKITTKSVDVLAKKITINFEIANNGI